MLREIAVAIFVEVFHGAGLRQFAQVFHLLEVIENLGRLLLVQPAQREADVDDDVITDLGFGT